MKATIALAALTVLAGTTFAGPTAVDSSQLVFDSGDSYQARLRGPVQGNWELRLETDTTPNNGDNVANLFNNNPDVNEDLSTGVIFSLANDPFAQLLTWTVTLSNGATNTLTLSTADAPTFNTIQISVAGRRGSITEITSGLFLEGSDSFDFSGLAAGGSEDPLNSLFLFFGNDADVFDSTFVIGGTLDFDFENARDFPGEDARLNITFENATLIPLPTAGLLGLAGLGAVAARRRRAL